MTYQATYTKRPISHFLSWWCTKHKLHICIKCFCYFGQHMYVDFLYIITGVCCICVVASKVLTAIDANTVWLIDQADWLTHYLFTISHENWYHSSKRKSSEETICSVLLCSIQCLTSVMTAEGNVEFCWRTVLVLWQKCFRGELNTKPSFLSICYLTVLFLNCWFKPNHLLIPPALLYLVSILGSSSLYSLSQCLNF